MPRLDSSVARELLGDRWNMTVETACKVSTTSHPRQKFASNGDRFSPESVGQFVSKLRNAASRLGFPIRLPSEKEARAWDAEATQITWDFLCDLVVAEAGRSDVWAFLTVVACPDLVLWRYGGDVCDVLPSRLEARFLGGRRNLLKRFWQRGRALSLVGIDCSLVNKVREDDMQQVFERSTLAAIPRLAGTVLCQLANSAEGVSARDLLKRLNRELAVTAMYVLPNAELDELVSNHLSASQKAIAMSQKKTR